jgi:hypothetical protein
VNEPLWTLLLKVVVAPIIAAGLASYITYLLSHRRFIKERWWDRKADAYGNIIGSLVQLIYWLEWRIGILEGLRDGHSKEAQKVPNEYEKARAQIERVAFEGDYVISTETANALSELVKTLELAPDKSENALGSWLGRLHGYHTAAKSCLEAIRAEARSDLRVK